MRWDAMICLVKYLGLKLHFSPWLCLYYWGEVQSAISSMKLSEAEKSRRKDNSSCRGMQSHYWITMTSFIPNKVRKLGLAEASCPLSTEGSHHVYLRQSTLLSRSVVQSNKLFSVTTKYVYFNTEHDATSNSFRVVNLFQQTLTKG